MNSRIIKVCSEAYRMVQRNIKTYVLLSVTLVITFSFVGLFLFIYDSNIFNEHKQYLKVSPNIAFVEYGYGDQEGTDIDALLEKIDQYKNTYHCETIEIIEESYNSIIPGLNKVEHNNLHLVDKNGIWAYYPNYVERTELLDGTKEIHINEGEIIVNESLYNYIVEKNEKRDGHYYISIPLTQGNSQIMKEFKIVDVCKDSSNVWQSDETKDISFEMFISKEDYTESDLTYNIHKITILSDEIYSVMSEVEKSGLSFETPIYEKNDALSSIRNAITVKSMIIIAIIIILGINMYSCFSNALSERKYEIGVKRALGAKKSDIIIQFFSEGIIVMVLDIAISIMIIAIVLVGYKWCQNQILNKEWEIVIYNNTALMFLISCTFLSLFFSFLFSIMTINVEVIKYIKGE